MTWSTVFNRPDLAARINADRQEERRILKMLGVEKGKVSDNSLHAHCLADAAADKLLLGGVLQVEACTETARFQRLQCNIYRAPRRFSTNPMEHHRAPSSPEALATYI
jgi:hypothetical protein